MSRSARFVFVCLLLAFFGLTAFGQDPLPTVSFTLDFPHSDPEHYQLQVHSDGNAIYDSNGKITTLSTEGDPFHLEFVLSSVSTEKIFDLAKRANYFDGDFDSKLPNIAFTGKKILAYKDGKKSTQTTYNYAPDPNVLELTGFLQHLAITLEMGRELQFYHRYQKLALDDVLKRVEELVQGGQLSELSSIGKILDGIYKDPTVLRMTRVRTKRLIDFANAPAPVAKH